MKQTHCTSLITQTFRSSHSNEFPRNSSNLKDTLSGFTSDANKVRCPELLNSKRRLASTFSCVSLGWLALTYSRKYYPLADIVLFSFKGIKPAYISLDTGASLAARTPPLNDCRYVDTRERRDSGMQLSSAASENETKVAKSFLVNGVLKKFQLRSKKFP